MKKKNEGDFPEPGLKSKIALALFEGVNDFRSCCSDMNFYLITLNSFGAYSLIVIVSSKFTSKKGMRSL